MKRAIILTAILAIVCASASAQNSEEKFRPSLSIGYSRNYVDMGDYFPIHDGTYGGTLSCGSLFFDADLFRFNNFLSGGFYLGGQMAQLQNFADNGTPFYTSYFAGRLGISAHLHLLGILNVATNAWDIAVNASMGAFWCPNISPQSEYGLGLSAAYYPLKRLGISVGCDFGKTMASDSDNLYVQKSGISLKAGLNIKLGKY